MRPYFQMVNDDSTFFTDAHVTLKTTQLPATDEFGLTLYESCLFTASDTQVVNVTNDLELAIQFHRETSHRLGLTHSFP